MKHAAIPSQQFWIVAFAFILVASATPSLAQPGTGSGPHRRMHGPMYNPGTEVTVTGTVVEVQQLTGQTMAGRNPKGWTGTHVSIRTDAGDVVVHVGPSAYLASKNFSIAQGDRLTILGSKVQYEGSDFLIAREITKGDQKLQLRDSRGFPLWRGYRRGTPMPHPQTLK